MSRRKTSLSQKIRNLLAEGKSPKEIAKILKCEPQKVYSVKYHMRRKQEGIAALKPQAPAYVKPVTSVVGEAQSGQVIFTNTEPKDNSTPTILLILAAFAVALVITLAVVQ